MNISSFFFILIMLILCWRGLGRNLVNQATVIEGNDKGNNSTTIIKSVGEGDVQCTKPCEQLSSYSCTLCTQICRNTTTGEVTSFSLTTCSLLTCKKWIQQPRSEDNPTATTPKCDEWQTKLLSDQQCSPSCCNAQFTSFTYENYEICIQTNNQQSSTDTKISTIIAAVLSSVLGFVVLLVFVLCCRQRISICCQNFFFAIQDFLTGEKLKKARDPSTDQSEHNQKPPKKVKKLKWETVHTKKNNIQQPTTTKTILTSQQNINPEIYCPICLQIGLNTHTHCDHHFHLVCLRQKLAKKLVCPECQSKHFNPLKITCDICGQKRTKYNMDKNTADFQLPQFLINKKIYCDACMKKSIITGHIKQSEIMK